MKKPECVLVRVGEIALKSPQVQRKFFNILVGNIKTALGSGYKIKTNPNRIFVYGDTRKAIRALKKVFGISSLSPVWTCFSGLNEIKLLAVDIAEQILTRKKTFAIRVRRSGRHKFSSQIIAEEVGAAIKRVTNARVDLTNPDTEIFIECRSRRTYIFTEKIKCEGGLPLGVSGKVVLPLRSKKDGVAGWLMMKRGCELIVVTKKRKLAEALKKWHIGKKMEIVVSDYKKALDIGKPLVTGETFDKEIKNVHAFRPIFFFDKKDINGLVKKIGI